ncbi:hypothetical protein EIP86_000282 [Pleurotus ostreatoroseus]|nr:hypothetical protein EIP86_000282 [Pleurotus ostreatoroseus]
MPELPEATRTRLQALGLSQRDAEVLMSIDSGREVGYDGKLGHGAVSYFDSVAIGRDAKVVVNWVTHELLGQLSHRHETFKDNPLSVEQMGDLIDLVQCRKITGTSGKTILRHILEHRTSALPSVIARDSLLLSTTDSDDTLQKWCDEAIDALQEEAQAVRDGNPNVVNKLVGYIMKRSRGTADAKAARKLLQLKLTSTA